MAKRILLFSGVLLATSALSPMGYAQVEYSFELEALPFYGVTRAITLQDAGVDRVVTPAEFRTETKLYVSVEAHCPGEQLVEHVTTIEVSPAYSNIELVPGKYETVAEEVIVQPATAGWDATENGGFEYVVTDPVVRTLSRRVETKAPSERHVSVPSQTRTLVTQRRAAGAATLNCANPVPAQTQTVERLVLVTAPQIRMVSVPAQTRSFTQSVSANSSFRVIPRDGGREMLLDLDSVGPKNPTHNTLYKPVIRNEQCVLWKSFNKVDAIVEEGRFPWPPPNPSTESTLPEAMFAGVETLGDMNTRLISALDALGYQDRRRKYFPVPHGFALVTEIEQIDDTGRPLSGASRWTDDIFVVDPPSIFGWLKALVTRATGRFRVFALIVTSEDVNTEGAFDDREIALDWLNSGTGALNRDRAACAFTASHRVTALVYEFEHSERQEPFLVSNTLINHIAGSGLRAQLAKVGATP